MLLAQGMGTAANVGNTFTQTRAAQAQQDYSSGMTQVNAGWAGMQANDVTRRGNIAASRDIMQGRQNAATAKVKAAGGNQDVNIGSGAIGASEARLFADIQSSDAQNAAYRQALGLRAEQAAMLGRDRLARLGTRNYVRNSFLQLGAQVGSDALRGYATFERYRGLGQNNGGKSLPQSDYNAQENMRPIRDAWNKLD